MAQYRIRKRGDDDYQILAQLTSAKGGSIKLVVVRSNKSGLAEAAEDAAGRIGRHRAGLETPQDDASELDAGGAE